MRDAEFLQVVDASRFAFGVLRPMLNHAEILAAVRFENAGVGVFREWGHSPEILDGRHCVGQNDGTASIDYGCACIRVCGIVRRAVRERHTVDVGGAGRNLFGSVPHALLTKSHFHDSGLFSVRGISGPESDELNLLCRRSPQFEGGAILFVCRAKVVYSRRADAACRSRRRA